MMKGAACHGSPSTSPISVAKPPASAMKISIINHVWRLLAAMRS